MKKVVRSFAFAVGYVLAYCLVLILFFYAADVVATDFQINYTDDVAFVFGNVLMLGLLFYFRHKTRDRRIRAEAEQWLAERPEPLVHARRRRMWHAALWIPSVLVLTIFLFFPETAGLVSHMFCGPTVKLGQYRVKIPLTWIVATRSDSAAWVIAGKGIARVGFRRYWRAEAPISEISIYGGSDSSEMSEWYLAHAKVLSRQAVKLGQEELMCLDHFLRRRAITADQFERRRDFLLWRSRPSQRQFFGSAE